VKDAVRRRHADLVIRIDVAQLAEERIAMAGQSNVADFTGQRGARNVADSKPQRTRVASRANDGGDAEARNLDAPHG